MGGAEVMSFSGDESHTSKLLGLSSLKLATKSACQSSTENSIRKTYLAVLLTRTGVPN